VTVDGWLTYEQLRHWPAGRPIAERRYLADGALWLRGLGTPGAEFRGASPSREQGEYRRRLARVELESWLLELERGGLS
jgi:hypothetical protein